MCEREKEIEKERKRLGERKESVRERKRVCEREKEIEKERKRLRESV